MSTDTVRHRNNSEQGGFTQIPNAVLCEGRITAMARLCYAILKSYAWGDPNSFAGQQTLADQLGVSDRSVRYYLTELEILQLITIEQRGLGKTNVYWIETLPDMELVIPTYLEYLQERTEKRRPEINFQSGADRKSIADQAGNGFPTNNTKFLNKTKTLPNGNGATKDKPKSLKRYDERFYADKLSKSDVILKALAIELFNIEDDPLAIASVEGRLKSILFGQKNDKVIVGLLEWEIKQNNGVPDYAAIAAAVPGYAEFCLNHATSGGKIVTSEDKFITYWMQYRNTTTQNAAPEWTYDPERPGVKIRKTS